MKKIFCLILTFAMCVSLCACGGVDARYTDLIACLDNHDYEGAYDQIMMLRDEAIANGDIVVVDPQEEDYELVNRYQNIAYQLNDYKPDSYFGIWVEETEKSLNDNAALAYCYEQLQELEGVDQWLDHEYFSYLKEDGVPTDRLALLDRFTIVENQLLSSTSKTKDNMGNEIENDYGAWYYDENGTLVKYYKSWDAPNANWEDLLSVSGYFRYTYNDAGVITETKVTNQDNTNVEALIVPAYDEAGNLISETITDNYGTYTSQYTYDANGNRIQMDFADDWSTYTVYYTYDAEGRLTQKDVCDNSTINYNGEDMPFVRGRKTTVNTYDASGNLVSAVVTDVDYNWNISSGEITTEEWGKRVDTVSYTYDAEGRLVQEVWQYGNMEYTNGDVSVSPYSNRTIDYTYGDFYIFK